MEQDEETDEEGKKRGVSIGKRNVGTKEKRSANGRNYPN